MNHLLNHEGYFAKFIAVRLHWSSDCWEEKKRFNNVPLPTFEIPIGFGLEMRGKEWFNIISLYSNFASCIISVLGFAPCRCLWSAYLISKCFVSLLLRWIFYPLWTLWVWWNRGGIGRGWWYAAPNSLLSSWVCNCGGGVGVVVIGESLMYSALVQ